MRLIHTADWHLGRLFHGVHLTADQTHVLEQIVGLVAELRPHALLVAGDVYDRAVPPTEAVELLDRVLHRVVEETHTPLLLVAGNHDSPARLGFGAALLAERGLHVAGPLEQQPRMVLLRDEHGLVAVHLLPFAEPAVARATYGRQDLHDQAAVVQAGVASARAQTPPGARSVLLTHAFVAGSLTSESERPLTVGGTGAVPAELFAGFDYVALGHLHRRQNSPASTPDGIPRIAYAGSPLAYSFDESDQHKSVTVVDIGPPGSGADGLAQIHVETVPLRPRRGVRRLTGTLSEILAAARQDAAREDYVEAMLQDRGPLFDAMGRLRAAYPNALSVVLAQVTAAAGERRTRPDPRRASDLDMLGAFLEHVSGDPPTEQESRVFAEIVDRLAARERESPAVSPGRRP